MKFVSILVASVYAATNDDDEYRAGQGDNTSGGSSGIGGTAILGTDCEIMGNWGCRSVTVEALCCGKATPDLNQTPNTATTTIKVCNIPNMSYYIQGTAKYTFVCDKSTKAMNLVTGFIFVVLGTLQMMA